MSYGCIGSTAWAIGVAARALHEIAEIAKAGRARMGGTPLREQDEFQRDFGLHKAALEAARIQLVSVYDEAVDVLESGASEEECKAAVARTMAHDNHIVKHTCKPATIFAWEASGSVGMRNPSRLQRCFRDMHIGAGHLVFDDSKYREFAKPSLGLEASKF
jgi:alkylation response protein AidB-like acyl-CoA dehydrogenase